MKVESRLKTFNVLILHDIYINLLKMDLFKSLFLYKTTETGLSSAMKIIKIAHRCDHVKLK